MLCFLSYIIDEKLLFFILLFSLARAFHYFYDVAMPPTRRVFTNWESVQVAMKLVEFQKLYKSKDMTSSLRIYKDREQANTTNRSVDAKVCSPTQMLKLNIKGDIVDQSTLDKALDNRFVHVGLRNYINDNTSFEKLPNVEVGYETVRTKAFLQVLKASNLSKDYCFGCVTLPKEHKNPYSLFGRSMNDATIM